MRIRILLFGDDPTSMVADAQLLRERGLLVFTAFNMNIVRELAAEVRPDIIFFNTYKPGKAVTDTYNEVVNDTYFSHIPVIYTLSEDDVYLVTRKRTEPKEHRTAVAGSIIEAVRKALAPAVYPKSNRKTKTAINSTAIQDGYANNTQMKIPFYR